MDSSTAQVDTMSPEETKIFLRDLLDHSAMCSPEVNRYVRKMLRGQRDQVAWFDRSRMEPGAAAECLSALVDAKPKKSIGAIVKSKKLCVKCKETPRQSGKEHEGCCFKCSSAAKKLCVKYKEIPRRSGKEHEGCCFKCSPAAKPLCVKCKETPRQNGKEHEGCCFKCSLAVKPLCVETPAQGGIHGDRCYKHTSRALTIELLGDTVDNLDTLVKMTLYWLRQDDPTDPEWIEKYVVYIGLMGTTGQAEIDQDEKRMIEAGLMDAKQYVTYVEFDEFHSSKHDVARDAERYSIRQVGLDNLMNSCHGGDGRISNDASVGGVFLLVGVKYAIRE